MTDHEVIVIQIQLNAISSGNCVISTKTKEEKKGISATTFALPCHYQIYLSLLGRINKFCITFTSASA